MIQGGEVEEVAGLRNRAAARTCSRRIQITKVLFTHGHDQNSFQSLPSNCHENQVTKICQFVIVTVVNVFTSNFESAARLAPARDAAVERS